MSTDRLKIVWMLGMGFALLLSWRLISLQIGSVDAYAHQARTQHVKQRVLPANRGRILDRRGRVLATNLESQSFFVNKISDLDSLHSIAVRFSHRAGKDESAILGRIGGKPSFVWLARKVIDGPPIEELPEGIGRIVEMRRSYPVGPLAAQVLGYTDPDGNGIEGLELAYDAVLKGRAGSLSARVDARGNVLSALGEIGLLPEDGEDLVLTLDADYQAIAEEELMAAIRKFNARSGIAIIMDPRSGEIYAMANVPLFDANAFTRAEPWVRRNRAVTDQFEPGSTFKVVPVAGALEKGLVQPQDSIFCENGRLAVPGGHVIRDTQPVEWLTVSGVLEISSNIGTIKIARLMDRAALFRYVRLFGFGAPTGIEMPGEVSGQLRHPSQWSNRSLETIAIGQEVAGTAMQLASAFAAIANGGRLMTPRIILKTVRGDSVSTPGVPRPIRQVISPETAKTLTALLEGVVSRGTGKNARVPGYRVAGKTGTAQQVRDGKPGYDPDRFISSFVGFLPADAPELLCLVAIDGPQNVHWAAQVAAPAFSKIMQRVLSLRETPMRHRTRMPNPGEPAPMADAGVNLVGLSPRSAETVLGRLGYRSQFTGEGDRVVGHQLNPEQGKAKLFLTPAEGGMPDLRGATARQAVSQLTAMGMRVELAGTGLVVDQTPRPGSPVTDGQISRIICTPDP